MKSYSKEFLKQKDKLEKLEASVEAERKKLQDLCPHVHLNGRSAFPNGISFTDCSLCGMSSHDT
jgi:hypothetical protein